VEATMSGMCACVEWGGGVAELARDRPSAERRGDPREGVSESEWWALDHG
jgi:hypothetical protein